MKVLRSIQLKSTGPVCRNCKHFQNDPALIEAVYRGLKTMGSGFSSVRDEDGFCNQFQLYLSARDSCPHFSFNKSLNIPSSL
ncbi:MAG TPA: hypothetical protein VGI38_07880 [Puia sp.]|jgi:hypothetical protein